MLHKGDQAARAELRGDCSSSLPGLIQSLGPHIPAFRGTAELPRLLSMGEIQKLRVLGPDFDRNSVKLHNSLISMRGIQKLGALGPNFDRNSVKQHNSSSVSACASL